MFNTIDLNDQNFNKCFKFECSCIIISNQHEDEKKVIKMTKKLTSISNFNVPLEWYEVWCVYSPSLVCLVVGVCSLVPKCVELEWEDFL
jgi:hypothetical protein